MDEQATSDVWNQYKLDHVDIPDIDHRQDME